MKKSRSIDKNEIEALSQSVYLNMSENDVVQFSHEVRGLIDLAESIPQCIEPTDELLTEIDRNQILDKSQTTETLGSVLQSGYFVVPKFLD